MQLYTWLAKYLLEIFTIGYLPAESTTNSHKARQFFTKIAIQACFALKLALVLRAKTNNMVVSLVTHLWYYIV